MNESALPRRISTLAWVLILAGFLGAALVSSSTAPTLQRTLLIAMLLGGASFEALASGLARRRPALLCSPAALAVTLGCVIAAAVGPRFYDSIEQLTWWTALALGGASLAGMARDTDARRDAATALLSLTVLVCVHGLAQRFYLYDLLRDERLFELVADDRTRPFLGSRRIRSTFGQANGMACFLVTMLPLVQLTLAGRTRTFLTLLVGVALLLTGSAGGGLVAMGLAAVLARCHARRKLSMVLGAAWLGAMIVAATPSWFGIELKTAQLRLEYWGHAVEVIRETFPRGTGAGMFRWVSEPLTSAASFSSHPHQAILAVASETGLVGLVVLGILAWRALSAWRRPAATDEGEGSTRGRRAAIPVAAAATVMAPAMHFADLPAPWAQLGAAVLAGVALIGFARWLAPRLDTRRLPLACGLGVAAFSAHAMIDFDLYVPGALAAAAALAALWSPPLRRSASAGWGLGLAVLPLALALFHGTLALEVASTEILPAAGGHSVPVILDGDDVREMTDRAARPLKCRIDVAHRFVGVLESVGMTAEARRIAEAWGPPFPGANTQPASTDGR